MKKIITSIQIHYNEYVIKQMALIDEVNLRRKIGWKRILASVSCCLPVSQQRRPLLPLLT
jgi:hypothetical protein